MVKLVEWTGLLNGDVGEYVSLPEYGDLTVTFGGTFGAGGTIKLRGNNGETFTTNPDCTDPQGNAISKTGDGMELVAETPLRIRPEATAGDGSTNLTCRILARRGSR